MSDLLRPAGFEPLPRFTEERLLIASSSDVRKVRNDAVTLLGPLLARLAPERPIRPYDWETCVAEVPFDPRVSMHENLRRPTEPGCVGVICLFGERIGFPLHDEFPASTIPGWESWSDPRRRYHVVHPWPDEDEKERQLELVENGAFPLTGTVCEALDAMGADSVQLHVACFADRAVTPDGPRVRLNGHAWRNMMHAKIEDTNRAAGWLKYDYAIQERSVANFLNALHERRRDVHVHQTDHQALEAIQRFVEERVVPRRLTVDNPYHSLDFYGILDGDDLPGRAEETREAVLELKARGLAVSREPMVVRITGESGCGKTSFLRAGVLAALVRPHERGRFRVVAVRPTDFHDEDGHPDRNVPFRLLEIIARENADLGLSATAYARVAGAGPRAARSAVDALVHALDAAGEDAPTLVIGLDQFEEIVDDLGAADRRPYAANWRPLLSFVELAVASRRIGLVYTLESSRQKLFEEIDLPPVLRAAHEVPLGGASARFLTAVITEPFRNAGYRISPLTVSALLASYRSYSRETGGQASLLPLLSLKLFNLFETVQGLPGVRPRAPSGGELHAQFDEREAEVPHDQVKDDLRFDGEIAELAERAWNAGGKPGEEQLDDLNLFLTPLVGLSGEEMDQITLRTVGDTLFILLEERLAAFEHVRLIIRENGRRRLVHEAVVRQWPLAARWLGQRREHLLDEARFRTDANRWAGGLIRLPADETSIDIAAAVLHGHLLEWPYGDPARLSAADATLKSYCQAIFRQSETPERTDPRRFRRGVAHVHVAASYGMTDLLGKFVRLRPDCLAIPTSRGTTPLDQAAWSSAATTRFLLEQGAGVNVDKQGWSTISCAVWRNDLDTFRALLPRYRTLESLGTPEGTNLLHIAARRGAVEIASALLAAVPGLDPAAKDDRGRTPLDFAAMDDQPETFDFFEEHWDARHRGENGWTVLHYAAYFGSARVVDQILSRPRFDAIVDARNDAGQTALMVAAAQRHDAVVRRLAAVMDPNAQVPEEAVGAGWTALHFAIAGSGNGKRETRASRHQALRTVRALLDTEGIDPNLAAADGQVPLTLARSLPHVRDALVQHPGFVSGARLPDGSTPLNVIIESGKRSAVERMLRSPDVDVELLSADGSYAPSLMIRNDMADLALGLLESGRVDPWQARDAKDIGLGAAISGGHMALVTAYLQKVPESPDPWHRRHLSAAATAVLMSEGPDALMERLLSLGARPESRPTPDGWTLFHYAALVGNVEAFDRLARVSPGTAYRDQWGRLPADLAPDHLRAEFRARMTEPPGESAISE